VPELGQEKFSNANIVQKALNKEKSFSSIVIFYGFGLFFFMSPITGKGTLL
jgi:hypothetical protein